MSPPFWKRRFVSLFENGGDMGEVFVVWEGMNLLQSAAIALFFVWDALVYDIIAERFPSINRARQPHFVTDLHLLI